MKIVVVGLGYVGLSLSVLLSQYNKVVGVDVIQQKVDMINSKQSPIEDKEIQEYLSNKKLDLTATTDLELALVDADYVFIATPTNYNEETQYFDTSSVTEVAKRIIDANKSCWIVIKSTIPVDYTSKLITQLNCERILFSPEFLREGHALYDNLYPSRVIIGCDQSNPESYFRAETAIKVLLEGAINKDVPRLIMSYQEAEAVKLFANTYLAMRVAYFNELDTYCSYLNLDTKNIINGICTDPRIGTHYNNPSFGYGGYCLPKDTKQLKANYYSDEVPETLISAIVESNEQRKQQLANDIMSVAESYSRYIKSEEIIGIYRLTMKSGSDNFRSAAIFDIINVLKNEGKTLLIYEPMINAESYDGIHVENNLSAFKEKCTTIVANRVTSDLDDVKTKLFTRDVFGRD